MVDQASLDAIRNPTGGRLTQIGQVLAQASQRKKQNELEERRLNMTKQLNKAKLDEAQLEAIGLQSIAIGAYSQSVMEAMKNVPANLVKDPNAVAQVQKQVYNSLPEGIKSVIPDKPQSLESIKMGLENATLTQEWLQSQKKATGTSEFERNRDALVASGQITQEEADDMTEKRVGVMSGVDITKAKETTENRLAGQNVQKATDNLRDDYSEGSEHLKKISNNIDAALAVMDTGDTELTDKLLAQVMSQVQDTDVRAFQMYAEFNKPFGNLMERITGQVSRFFQGSRTEKERQVIAQTLKHFKENYAETSLSEVRNMYRNQAVNQGLDPFKVVPPTSPEDIRDYPNISRKEKKRLLELNYPDMFK